MENLPLVAADMQLSKSFDQLPSVLTINTQLRDRAVQSISQKLEMIKAYDLSTLEVTQGDIIDSELNDLQVRGTDSIELNKDRRSVFTKEFDRIRSLFTQSENDILFQVDLIKKWRSSWNAEKNRRIVEAQKAQQQKLEKQNAEIAFSNDVTTAINNYYIVEKANMIDRINQAFYLKTIEELTSEHYQKTLKEYNPIMPDFDFSKGIKPHPLLQPTEMQTLADAVKQKQFVALAADFNQSVKEECNRLLLLIPTRVAELKRIEEDAEAAKIARERQEREAKERNEALEKQRQEINQAAEATAAEAEMTASFDAVVAQPAISLSKGTKQKQKYTPTTHKAFIAIITWWVKNNMNLLTIDELNKKFSFMLTAANKSLNDSNGSTVIEAEGLLIEDDFKTRGTRS